MKINQPRPPDSLDREGLVGSDGEEGVGGSQRGRALKVCQVVGAHPLEGGARTAPLSQPFAFTDRILEHEVHYARAGRFPLAAGRLEPASPV